MDSAYLKAKNICHQWIDEYSHDGGFERRLDIFHGTDWRIKRDDPTFYAAAYPEIIALTRLLASPYWQALAFENLSYPHRFIEEVRRTVAPHYQWPLGVYRERYEPLADWIYDQVMIERGPSLLD
ncbi:hypothetical protein GCM10017559_03570 [Streptosporangium longisporum]|uniref:Uncharacterized protein n=1 Tax=Streptosporangium longisporum TaxID=46187 RepID=A0ABP6K9Y5_9ACTN